MKYKIYLTKKNQYEAVKYYIDIIYEAIHQINENTYCKIIHSDDDIEIGDLLITIEPETLFRIYIKYNILKKYKVNFINWYQGVVPIEAEQIYRDNLKNINKKNIFYKIYSIFRVLYLKYCESFSIKKSILNIFVSKEMEKYYKDKYKRNNIKSIIMPCFNSDIKYESFANYKKYTELTFVYAGNIAPWQCIDKTLLLYQEIEKIFKSAKLYILTFDVKRMNEIIKNYKINNVEIYNVKLEKLNDEISRFKYGFLIRENNVINNVATPVKMNTYLANGVIPIFSSKSIKDFNIIANMTNYKVDFDIDNQNWVNDIINKLENIEMIKIEAENIYKQYNNIFNNYYNKKYYLKLLIDEFMEIEENMRL